MSLTQTHKKFLSNRIILSNDDQSVKLSTTEEAETGLTIGSKPSPDLIRILSPDGVRIPSPDVINLDDQPNLILDDQSELDFTLDVDWEDFQNDSGDEGDYLKCTREVKRWIERQTDGKREQEIYYDRETDGKETERQTDGKGDKRKIL